MSVAFHVRHLHSTRVLVALSFVCCTSLDSLDCMLHFTCVRPRVRSYVCSTTPVWQLCFTCVCTCILVAVLHCARVPIAPHSGALVLSLEAFRFQFGFVHVSPPLHLRSLKTCKVGGSLLVVAIVSVLRVEGLRFGYGCSFVWRAALCFVLGACRELHS